MPEGDVGRSTAVEHLVEDSSFGARDARDLRDRAPRAAVEDIMSRVHRQAPVVALPSPGAVPHGATPTPDRLEVDWPGQSLLGRLREPARRELLAIGSLVRYRPDQEVLEQGSEGAHVLLLLDGMVKVQRTFGTGRTAFLAVRAAGDLVGEMAVLVGGPRSATVVTCGDVVAKLITSGELMSFLDRRDDAGAAFSEMVMDRLRWPDSAQRDFLSHPAAERVARVLAEVVQTYGREEAHGWTLGIPLTEVELAS
ncbi:Crp/Fnr family transcriptional regulator, partial [Saccharothrix luteola]|uniref:Crp/Fnr family transcriptional regulator n=1 Tax=Saccharothrix luteola TaxID=2893018 RepID=UPI001E513D87